ncbi:excitatory amino acid transporter 3 [Nothobranchius furzeri]|uniref:Amino acid transporter n=1 Tax=Nothobranchius furzeri TaxID=105023 RepID=A0A8C6VTX5_NOTFU|nr:excitatory amino acid transporter 3-like [Nothobranchius furzeri]
MESTKKWTSESLRRCFLRSNLLAIVTVGAVLVGGTVGVVLKSHFTLSSVAKTYMDFPGEILTKFLLLVSSLVVTSVITEVSTARVSPSRKITSRALTYFVITTALALFSGVLFVKLLKPGVIDRPEVDNDEDEELACSTADLVMDFIRNLYPHNLVQATFQHYKTQAVLVRVEGDGVNSSLEEEAVHVRKVGRNVSGPNALGQITLAFLFGLGLRKFRNTGKQLKEIIVAVNMVIKLLVELIIVVYLPFGLVFMMARYAYEVPDEAEVVLALVKFVAVVVCGLTLHGLVLPLIYVLCVRRNPAPVIKGVSPALLKALLISRTSASTEASRCCESILSMDRRITRFMLPIGSGCCMNGKALYQIAAAVFIAQLSRVSLDWSQLITLGLTVAAVTVGVVGIPATGSVTTFLILTITGIPLEAASILPAVEWLLDRLGAFVNVLGDSIGVALVQHLSEEELKHMGAQELLPDSGEAAEQPEPDPSQQDPDVINLVIPKDHFL